MKSHISNIKSAQYFLPIILVAYVFVLSLGATTIMTDENGSMSGCPFMTGSSICPMGILEHISTFQSIFNAIFSKTFLYLTVLILSYLIISSSLPININSPPKFLSILRSNRKRFFSDQFLLAISDGRIQPKLFS